MTGDEVDTELEYLMGRGVRVLVEPTRLGRRLWPDEPTREDLISQEVGHHVELEHLEDHVRCELCKFFHHDLDTWGTCRHQPPVQPPGAGPAAWPEIRVDDWCGRFLRPYRQSDKL